MSRDPSTAIIRILITKVNSNHHRHIKTIKIRLFIANMNSVLLYEIWKVTLVM